MKKQRKKKEKLETRNTLIIFAIVIVFVVGMLVLNAITSFRRLDVRTCVEDMVLIEKAMQVMRDEYKFRFDLEREGSQNILRSLAIYFNYGQEAFTEDEDGFLHLKSRDELEKLSRLNRTDRLLTEIPRCPSDAEYVLIPSTNEPGLFDVRCPKHDLLEQPNQHGKYEFSGDLNALTLRKTEVGSEARVYFPKHITLPEKYVRVVSNP
jgi:hypothetical protein